MKRLHVHVGVSDLGHSVDFYSALFGAEPSVLKPDYAKWLLDDPRVNFAISSGRHAATGVEHLGIQAEDEGALAEIRARLADRPMLEEGAATCCYAKSEKSWAADPDGVAWEAFFTTGEADIYGDGPAFSLPAGNTAAAACCSPKPERSASFSRCG